MRKARKLPPLLKVQTVPGGSNWKCTGCGSHLKPGIKVVRKGREVFCSVEEVNR